MDMDIARQLDSIQVASPCTANWQGMTGDDRVRHCTQCQLRVYNLSDMSSEEATDLVFQTEGRLCVAFSAATTARS